MTTLFVWLLGAASAAPPNFLAGPDTPAEWAELASRAWREASNCVGREATASSDVPLVRTTLQHGGDALVSDGTLTRIRISDVRPNNVDTDTWSKRVVLHEIAHAWSHHGPHVVVEGAAEVIADCIAGRLGQPSLLRSAFPHGGIDLTRPMKSWDRRSVDNDGGYDASWSVMSALSHRVPLGALAPPGGFGDWDEFVGQLGEADPAISRLLEAADAPRSNKAWRDVDDDGLVALVESAFLLSDDEPDTDGDGVGDALEIVTHPAYALHLPADTDWHCSGWRGVPTSHLASVSRAGPGYLDLETHDAYAVVVRGDGVEAWVWPALPPDPDATCIEGPGLVLVDEMGLPADWRGRLQATIPDSGPSPKIVVEVGGATTGIDAAGVHLSEADVMWSIQHEQAGWLLERLGFLAEQYRFDGPNGDAVIIEGWLSDHPRR